MATGERRSNLRLLRTSLILDQGDTRKTRHGDCLKLCIYNARTVSTDADLHALLGAAERIKSHVIALQETKCRRSEIRQMNDGTLFIHTEKIPFRNVGFIVHPSVVHLVDSHEVLTEEEYRIGKFGLGDRNENGNRLSGQLSAARLFHGNSLSWEDHRRWTWESPSGTTCAEIDHILTNRRWRLLDVSVVPSFCGGSDHISFVRKYDLATCWKRTTAINNEEEKKSSTTIAYSKTPFQR